MVAIQDDPINDNEVCKKCRTITNDLLEKRRSGGTRDEMYNIFKTICVQYMFQGEEYCEGVINHELVYYIFFCNVLLNNNAFYDFQDIALYIIDNRKNLTGARICAIYLQYEMCEDPDLTNWSVNIPEKSLNKTIKVSIKQIKCQLKHLLHLLAVHTTLRNEQNAFETLTPIRYALRCKI